MFFSTSLLAFGIAILKGWIMINDNVAKELANEVFYISGGIFLLFLLSLFLFCKNLMKRVARRKRLRKRARVFDQN